MKSEGPETDVRRRYQKVMTLQRRVMEIRRNTLIQNVASGTGQAAKETHECRCAGRSTSKDV